MSHASRGRSGVPAAKHRQGVAEGMLRGGALVVVVRQGVELGGGEEVVVQQGEGEGGVRGAGGDADEGGEGAAQVVEGAVEGGGVGCHGFGWRIGEVGLVDGWKEDGAAPGRLRCFEGGGKEEKCLLGEREGRIRCAAL